MVHIAEVCTVSVNISFVSQGRITQSGSVIVDQVKNDRNLSLLLSDELHSDHYCVLKPDEGKERKPISIQLIL